MNKELIIASSVVVVSSGVAIWALVKLYEAKKELRKTKDKYDDNKTTQKYLMHHYGSIKAFPLLKKLIATECEHFHLRVATLCKVLCIKYGVPLARILDVGSATGALSFYLSETFQEVIATDTSYFMTVTCQQLKESGEAIGLFSDEGGAYFTPFVAKVPSECRRERVQFWDEDVCNFVFSCGQFNCVVVVNTLTDLAQPKDFLSKISEYVLQGGLLIVADTYNWQNGPEVKLEKDDALKSFDLLKIFLSPKWKFMEESNEPFYVINSARSAEIGNCHLTIWKRNSDLTE